MTPVRPFVIALATLALGFACDHSPTGLPQPIGPSLPLVSVSSPQVTALPCSSLPYDSVTQLIGPDGGRISIGPHTLVIPQGALPKDTVSITAVLPTGTGMNGVLLRPEGLKFKTSVYLTMSYPNCQQSSLSKLVAYMVGGKVVEKQPSVDDPLAQTVTGQVDHFSNYAVAW